MPWAPKKVCARPGCGALVDGRYCDAHRREVQAKVDAKRPSARARGYDSKWEKARADYLRLHPWCCRCAAAGVHVAATHVDHVIPHKGDQGLFWSRSNWQPLCGRCHSSKTARDDGGFGRPVRS